MINIATIAAREFKGYFLSPIAYVYLITFLVVTNWVFFHGFFLIGQADLRPLFTIMPLIFLFFAPAVAMGRWAEERKLGTLELLFTLPVKDWQAVAAKFIAGLMLMAVAVLLTMPAVITAELVGNLDWGPVVGGMVGTVLLGGAYLSIGLMFSALTENQIIAFILGVAGCFVMLVVGTPLIAGGSSGMWASVATYAGLGTHFQSIARGVIDMRDIIYYLSVIGFFLYLNLVVVRTKAK
jgi:ABC-2 type transport system permease protein